MFPLNRLSHWLRWTERGATNAEVPRFESGVGCCRRFGEGARTRIAAHSSRVRRPGVFVQWSGRRILTPETRVRSPYALLPGLHGVGRGHLGTARSAGWNSCPVPAGSGSVVTRSPSGTEPSQPNGRGTGFRTRPVRVRLAPEVLRSIPKWTRDRVVSPVQVGSSPTDLPKRPHCRPDQVIPLPGRPLYLLQR